MLVYWDRRPRVISHIVPRQLSITSQWHRMACVAPRDLDRGACSAAAHTAASRGTSSRTMRSKTPGNIVRVRVPSRPGANACARSCFSFAFSFCFFLLRCPTTNRASPFGAFFSQVRCVVFGTH
jgi:hypothetical protein